MSLDEQLQQHGWALSDKLVGNYLESTGNQKQLTYSRLMRSTRLRPRKEEGVTAMKEAGAATIEVDRASTTDEVAAERASQSASKDPSGAALKDMVHDEL
jgi:hypothetical protein